MAFMSFFKKKKESSPPAPKGMALPPLPAAPTGMPEFPAIPQDTVQEAPETGPIQSDLPAIKVTDAPPEPEQQPGPIAVGPHPLGSTETVQAPVVEAPQPELPAEPIPPIEKLQPIEAPDAPLDSPLEDLPDAPTFEADAMPEEIHAVMPDLTAVPDEIPPLEGFPPVYRRESHGPVFVRLDQFKNVLSGIEDIRTSFTSEDDAFVRLEDVKSAEQKHFARFKNSLEDIQRKLMYVDKMLFEA